MEATSSIAKGHGSLNHNDRTIKNIDEKNKSWDPELSDQNYIMVNKSIKKTYKELFGESTKKYNQKQVENGHPERQIKNYYNHIARSQQEHLYYEIVVEVGNTNQIKKGSPEEEIARKVLREYCRGFEARNPNFKVVQMIEHNDEAMICHDHIDIIPVSYGNKRGLETKNSLSGALREMGYGRGKQSFALWRANEQKILNGIMREYGIEPVLGDSDLPHMSMPEYKETMKIVSQEAQKKLSEVEIPEPEVKVQPITKKRSVVLSEAEYEDLMKAHAFETEKLKAENEVLRADKEIRDQKLRNMTSKAYVVENERLEAELNETKQELSALKVSHEELNQKYDEVSEKLESTKSLYQMSLQENRELEKDMKKAWIQVDELKEHVESLKNRLSVAAQTIKSLVQGYETVRLGENSVKLTDRQERLFTALSTIGKSVLQKIGFKNHSEEMSREPYKINNEVKATIESLDQLEQRMKNKNLSHSRHRGMSR